MAAIYPECVSPSCYGRGEVRSGLLLRQVPHRDVCPRCNRTSAWPTYGGAAKAIMAVMANDLLSVPCPLSGGIHA